MASAGQYVHAEAFGYAGYIAAYLPEGVYAECFAFELGSGGAVIEVARHHYHHAECQLGYGVGVLPGCVHDTYTVCCGGLEVDVVVSGSGAYYYFEVGSGVHYLGVDDVAAYDDAIDIGYGGEQLGLIGVFFEEHKLGACAFYDFAYAFYCNGSKGFLGSNKYLHGFGFSVVLRNLSLLVRVLRRSLWEGRCRAMRGIRLPNGGL